MSKEIISDFSGVPFDRIGEVRTQEHQQQLEVAGDMDLLWSSDQASSCYKNVIWSPDGTCALAALDNGVLELYEIMATDPSPTMRLVFSVAEPEIVYDYCWSPIMSSQEPATCLFASTGRDQPIHVWDAFTGKLRTSLSPRNDGDELHTCISVAITPDGAQLYGGTKDGVYIFDLAVSDLQERWKMRDKENDNDFSGLVSTIAFRDGSDGEFIAAGSYMGTIGMFDRKTGTHWVTLRAHERGVSRLKFSHCGTYLWAAGRCAPDLICWDLRYLAQPLHQLPRSSCNYQRVDFDLDRTCRFVVTGSQDGRVIAYDLLEVPILPCSDPVPEYWVTNVGPGDSCNGISLNPVAPFALTSSGMRHFDVGNEPDDDDNDDDRMVQETIDYCLRLWKIELDPNRPVKQHPSQLTCETEEIPVVESEKPER